MRTNKPHDSWINWTAATVIATLHRYYESDAPTLSDISITHVSFDRIGIPERFRLVDYHPRPEIITVVLKPQVL